MTNHIEVHNFVRAIDQANRNETLHALQIARANARDYAVHPTARVIWRDLARLLKRQYREFAS